jgi:hypothetical protein
VVPLDDASVVPVEVWVVPLPEVSESDPWVVKDAPDEPVGSPEVEDGSTLEVEEGSAVEVEVGAVPVVGPVVPVDCPEEPVVKGTSVAAVVVVVAESVPAVGSEHAETMSRPMTERMRHDPMHAR